MRGASVFLRKTIRTQVGKSADHGEHRKVGAGGNGRADAKLVTTGQAVVAGAIGPFDGDHGMVDSTGARVTPAAGYGFQLPWYGPRFPSGLPGKTPGWHTVAGDSGCRPRSRRRLKQTGSADKRPVRPAHCRVGGEISCDKACVFLEPTGPLECLAAAVAATCRAGSRRAVAKGLFGIAHDKNIGQLANPAGPVGPIDFTCRENCTGRAGFGDGGAQKKLAGPRPASSEIATSGKDVSTCLLRQSRS